MLVNQKFKVVFAIAIKAVSFEHPGDRLQSEDMLFFYQTGVGGGGERTLAGFMNFPISSASLGAVLSCLKHHLSPWLWFSSFSLHPCALCVLIPF